jgi:hypothetical protein
MAETKAIKGDLVKHTNTAADRPGASMMESGLFFSDRLKTGRVYFVGKTGRNGEGREICSGLVEDIHIIYDRRGPDGVMDPIIKVELSVAGEWRTSDQLYATAVDAAIAWQRADYENSRAVFDKLMTQVHDLSKGPFDE